MHAPSPLISVIVPTYQRDDMLARCLDCLAPGAQTLDGASYEVIVTDDGRNSTAEAMIRRSYPWAHWVAGPQRGPAANRNHGAGQARGEWLAFTDDDCLPDAHWLAAFWEASKAAAFQVFEGRVYADRPQRLPDEIAPLNESGGYLWSCNILIKKSLFDELKGFSEQFPYACMEDVEFRYRLTSAGHDFLFVPQASLCHPWRLHGGWKTLKQSQESMLIFLKIHPEMRRSYGAVFYLRVLAKAFLQLVRSFLQMRWKGVSHNFSNAVNSLQMIYLVSR